MLAFALIFWKMLNSAPGTLVKEVKNIKNCFGICVVNLLKE
jgi:hypothetical protein